MVSRAATSRRALVIGAGQIGAAVSRELLGRAWSQIVMVTRTRDSATRLAEVDWVRNETGSGRAVIGYGDMLSGPVLTFLDGGRAPIVAEAPGGLLAAVIAATAADDIVDATNVATQLGGQHQSSSIETVLNGLCGRLTTLNRLLREDPRLRYVRVSTTGLGGLGLELPFTHGDENESVMSTALWRKLQISGVEHHGLWAMARSYPGRVHLVVPAAAVGFEGASTDGLVAAGEGKVYSLQEILLMTHPAMMGAITKEEVAGAVADILLSPGDERDLLAAMQAAALGPSTDGAGAVEQLREKLSAHPDARITTGSLGPFVTEWISRLTTLLSTAGHQPLGQVVQEQADKRWEKLRAFLRSTPGRRWADVGADSVDAGLLLADMFAAEGRGRPR